MPTQFLNPPGLAPTNGWTHVVSSTAGKTIYVSGQVSVDERGQVVGKGDLKAQTEQTFANLEVALKAAGASFRDVVKMNLYVVGLKPERAFVVHGTDGLDEVTTTGPTTVFEVTGEGVRRFEWSPADFGVEQATASDLAGGGGGAWSAPRHRPRPQAPRPSSSSR